MTSTNRILILILAALFLIAVVCFLTAVFWKQQRALGFGNQGSVSLEENTCKPGESRPCSCKYSGKPRGSDFGIQNCKRDGSGWDECGCYVDGLDL